MVVIQFQRLSMAEAEQCIAEIWTCLEEYHIPSPKMSFEFSDPLRTSITVNIDDSVAAKTIATRLSHWADTQGDTQDRRFYAKRSPRLRVYTESHLAGGAVAAVPLSFVLAKGAPPRSSYVVSRLRRK